LNRPTIHMAVRTMRSPRPPDEGFLPFGARPQGAQSVTTCC
jgi:hypothetical protein